MVESSDVIELDAASFADRIADMDVVLVEFYAPWYVVRQTALTVSRGHRGVLKFGGLVHVTARVLPSALNPHRSSRPACAYASGPGAAIAADSTRATYLITSGSGKTVCVFISANDHNLPCPQLRGRDHQTSVSPIGTTILQYHP